MHLNKKTHPAIYIVFTVLCLLLFVLPFLLVIAVSITDENTLYLDGYRLFPSKISFEGYRYVFATPGKIIQAYWITAAQSFLGTALSVFIMGLCAYPLSRTNFRWKKGVTFFIFFTMLFSGGLVPTYILNTSYLKLGNSFMVYVLPSLAAAFYIIIMRTFFQGLPESMMESAKIDGASEIITFFKIVTPLSKPVIATISLLNLLDRWNNWFTSLVYIRDESLYTLQYMLQRIMADADFINNMAAQALDTSINLADFSAPTESMRFALCIVAAGPMLLVFPFFQRYFVKGMTVGSVKG